MQAASQCAVCRPFNYPVNLCVSKMAPALMAGNTLVVKPPTQGAAAGAHMMQCFHKAGFPKGVFNFVTGVLSDPESPKSLVCDALHCTASLRAAPEAALTRRGMAQARAQRLETS